MATTSSLSRPLLWAAGHLESRTEASTCWYEFLPSRDASAGQSCCTWRTLYQRTPGHAYGSLTADYMACTFDRAHEETSGGSFPPYQPMEVGGCCRQAYRLASAPAAQTTWVSLFLQSAGRQEAVGGRNRQGFERRIPYRSTQRVPSRALSRTGSGFLRASPSRSESRAIATSYQLGIHPCRQ